MYRLEPEHLLDGKFYCDQNDVEFITSSDGVEERAKQMLEEGVDRVSIWQMVCTTNDPLKVCA